MMMIPRQTDVLVVGAGPVGLAVGVALAGNGVDVTVVDRQAQGENTSRAAVIHARTLEVLERIGVTERLTGLGIHAQRFTIKDRDRTLMPVRFDWLPTRYAYTLMVPQNVTEEVLLDRLTEQGGHVHRPYAAVALTQTDDGVDVTLDSGDMVHAKYVVAADGMHSTVRELAGLGYSGEDLPLSFSLADVHVDGGLPTDQVLLFFSPNGLLVSAPLPDGSFRIVAAVDPAPEDPGVEFVQGLLDARGPRRTRVTVKDVIWGSRFRIHERVAPEYRAGRVLLAGDAAHTHSPAVGQGMNLGLRDAVALGEALTEALRDGNAKALDEYADNSRREAHNVVSLAHRLTRLATVRTQFRPVRNLLLKALATVPAVRRTLALQLSGLTHR